MCSDWARAVLDRLPQEPISQGFRFRRHLLAHRGGLHLALAGDDLRDPHPALAKATANGINDKGEAVGWFIGSDNLVHGFLYDDGTYTTLGRCHLSVGYQ